MSRRTANRTKHRLPVALALCALIFSLPAPAAKPEQRIARAKPLYRETALVRAGRAQAAIIAPNDAAYAPLARQVAARIKAATGAVVPIKTDDQYAPTDRDRHLICLGQMMNNKLAFELYVPHHVACDDWYPGPDGYVVRTVCDPWGRKTNVIMLGGSDLAGVRRAVDRFCARVKPGRDLVLPRLMDIGLKDKEKMVQWLPGVETAFRARFTKEALSGRAEGQLIELAQKYYLTGADEFARALAYGLRRWMDAYYTWQPVRQQTSPKYSVAEMILAWDITEEHPAFDDAFRLEYTCLLFDYVRNMSRSQRIRQLEPGVLALTGQHDVSLSVSYGARYFKTYYPDIDLAPIETGLAHVRAGFDTIKQTYGFVDDVTVYTTHPVRATMLNSLFLGDLHYFTSGNARHWLRQSVIYLDNIGTVYGGNYPRIRYLGIGAWFYRDGRWTWLRNTLGGAQAHPRVTDTGFEFPLPWRFGPKEEPVEPTEWLEGLQWLPVHPVAHAELRRKRQQKRKNDVVNVPQEKTFHVMSFRQKFDPASEYLRLDGLNGLAQRGDGNAIMRFTAKGESWLHAGIWGSDSMKYHNSLLVLRDGQMTEQHVTFCALEAAADLPTCGLVQSVMREYNGVDWARNVIWAKGKYFLFADIARAREAGDYSLLLRWRPGPGDLDGNVFRKSRDGTVLEIANAGGCRLQSPADEAADLAQGHYGRLAPGDERAFINLLHVRGADEPKIHIGRLAPNVATLDGAGETALIGAVLPSGEAILETRAGGTLAVRARLFLFSAARLCAADLMSLNWTEPLITADRPVDVELDLAAGRLAVVARERCRLRVMGRDLQLAAKPGEMQTVNVPVQPGLREALAVDLRRLAASVQAADRPMAARQPERAKLLWARPGAGDARIHCLAAADLDGDGRAETLAGYSDGSVNGLDQSGRPTWQFKAPACINAVEAADLDGDGRPEVLVGPDDGHLYCLDARGREKWRFKTAGIPMTNRDPAAAGLDTPSGGNVRTIECADLDGDGRPEILAGTGLQTRAAWGRHGVLYCLNPAGVLKWHFYAPIGYAVSLSVGDVEADGRREVLLGTGHGGYGYAIYLLDSAGKMRTRYRWLNGVKRVALLPLSPGGPVRAVVSEQRDGGVRAFNTAEPFKAAWTAPCGGLTAPDPVIQDLDGDGRPEIVTASSGGSVYALNENGNGTGHEKWRVNLMAPLSAAIAADVLGDSRPELVVADLAGGVHVLDSAGRGLAYLPGEEPVSQLTAVPAGNKNRVAAATREGRVMMVAFE